MLINTYLRALERTVALTGAVKPEDLARPSPCVGWTLRDLLAHMVGQNRGFAAAVLGQATGVSAYAPADLGDDHVQTYADSAGSVAGAFVRTAALVPGGLESPVYLAEIRGGTTLPCRVAIEFHLVDCVAHGWDVARTIGHRIDFDDGVLVEALRIADAVPETAKSASPTTPFGRPVGTTSESMLDHVVAMLGRDPAWTMP